MKKAKKTAAPRSASKPRAKRAVTPEDLLQFQLVSDPQISPDGEWIAFTKKTVGDKNNYITNIWLAATNGSEVKQFTNGGKDGGARWSPDGMRIAFTSGREKPKAQIFTIGTVGGEAHSLTKFPEGSIGEYKWSPDGKSLAVSFRETEQEWTEEARKQREEKGLSVPARVIDDIVYRLDGDGYFNTARHKLFIVDAASGEHRKIFDKDNLGYFSFDWSPDSKQLVVSSNTDKNAIVKPWMERLYLLDTMSGKTTLLPKQVDGTKGTVKWSPNGKKIAYVGREGRDPLWGALNEQLFVVDPKTGVTKNLTEKEDYCIGAAILGDTRDASFGANIRWSADSSRIYMTFGWQGAAHVASVSAAGGKIEFHTAGDYEHGMGNWSDDGKSVALVRGSVTELNEIYVGNLSRGKIETKKLTRFNDDFLKGLEIVKPTSHWVTADDGSKVQVWVLKPANAKAKNPAVMEIHGGPHALYGVPFFHEFQVLAANGYVVFYSNPRGSKGYGEEHCNAIKGDWGNKDWLDVQAVTKFMQKQPYVDAKRMGVMGGSYGGYMTNWVIGHTDAFAGAITDRCVSNLVSMAGNSDFPNVPDTYWKGNAWDKPETLWDQSPVKYFGNVKTPTLIIHSEGDYRCNVEQADQVFTTLKLRGVPVRYVRYPSTTSHGMSRSGPPDLRLHRLHQILDWWQKYLKGSRR
jgi:acylaminoacyl-peptidase